MFRSTIFALLLFYSNYYFSQEKITINFQPLTIEDYDLFLQEILEQNGYQVEINYNSESKVRKGLKLDYIIANRKFLGVFDTIAFQLYNGETLIGNYEKILSIFTIGKKPQILNGLNETFNQSFSHNSKLKKKKAGYFNIPFTILKLDSISYFIIAKSPGMYNQNEVENAFLKMSKQYFEFFRYYSSSIRYGYAAPGPIITYHRAFMVGGIIVKNDKNEIAKMDKEPKELETLIRLTAHF